MVQANTPYFRTQVQFNIYLSCKWYLSHLQMQCALLKDLFRIQPKPNHNNWDYATFYQLKHKSSNQGQTNHIIESSYCWGRPVNKPGHPDF